MPNVDKSQSFITLVRVGYALFKLASGIADLQHRGHDTMGIAKRVGDIGNSVVYLTLAFAAFQFANDTRQTASGNSQKIAQPVLAWQADLFCLACSV